MATSSLSLTSQDETFCTLGEGEKHFKSQKGFTEIMEGNSV